MAVAVAVAVVVLVVAVVAEQEEGAVEVHEAVAEAVIPLTAKALFLFPN